jgi:hypothetical protein
MAALIVSADDIRKAVAEAEEIEKKALAAARIQDIADGKEPRRELYPNRVKLPGKDIVLKFITNPHRRELRAHTRVMPRDKAGSGNGYNFITSIPMVRNRDLADQIKEQLDEFLDYLLDEYDIPKRQRYKK